MGGGGGGIIKQTTDGINNMAAKWKNDPWNESVRLLSQAYMGGLAQYDPKHGIQQGGAIHRFKEIIGALDGTNRSRKAEGDAAATLEQANAMAKDAQNKEDMAKYRADLQASRGAQGIRDTAAARSSGGVAGTMGLGSDEKDFLGA